ncbi:hypothetical protein PpBr36_04662 [Pyricularia pennisetigena]|uniref:hypothetical protein n=1 Tax=Pyricularia pennisetigena TaxID=1578925 RepID=UPI00114F8DDC|nr:hypothetical protein PpBr36_04662 [Pyricularia pennisetigena]TLS26156.1 hypothetical protein PpBr36_04662 [Pyricularia pennisetigena]
MDAYDVPDSTDWLNTPLAALMSVEQAFRCHVCKDFYNTPMITSCSHTFCSLCIRRSLSVDGKCPLCRATDQENKLRGNHSMREAVDAFVLARASILEVARTPKVLPPDSEPPQTPKRKAENHEQGLDGETGRKRTRMSTRQSKAKGAQATAAMMRQETVLEVASSAGEYMDDEPDDGLAGCPICRARMKPERVYNHLDICPGEPQAPQTTASAPPLYLGTSQAPTKPLERLPPLNYSMLNDQQLRKKLSALGISTTGNRQLLERRHKEWVTIWNANCDSLRPKKRSELQQDLGVWERTVGAPAPSRAATLGAQIKDKDFDGEAWATKHQSSFKDLIANARKSRAKPKPEHLEQNVPHQILREGAPTPSLETPEQRKSDEVVDLTSPAQEQPQVINTEATIAGSGTSMNDADLCGNKEHVGESFIPRTPEKAQS